MPWTPSDGPARHTKKAKSAIAKKQWSDVANSVLAKTGDEGRAVRTANGVVAKRTRQRKPATAVESHQYNWRSMSNLKRGAE